MRIGIYLRISTYKGADGKTDQKRKTQDTEMQSREIQAHLKAKGWNNYQIFEDRGFTGTKDDRPALQKLLKACRMGEIDVVVCYRLDRLFRSLRDFLNVLNEFNKLGIIFVSVKEALDLSTPTGKLMVQICGAFAEFESNIIRERTISGLANAKAKGVRLGRPNKILSKENIERLKGKHKTLIEQAQAAGVSINTFKKAMGKIQ